MIRSSKSHSDPIYIHIPKVSVVRTIRDSLSPVDAWMHIHMYKAVADPGGILRFLETSQAYM